MICRTAKKYIQLDLDYQLDEPRQAALQQHLIACSSCRQQQQQLLAIKSAIHQLAHGEYTMGRDSLPSHSLNFEQPRQFPWPTAIAAAAAITLLITGWLTLNIPQTDSRPQQPVIAKTQKVEHPLAAAIPKLPENVRVTFDNDVISVPIKSDNPNVTILWVYPAIKTADKPDNPNDQPDSTGKDINHEKASKC
ncbi:MAG: anti-sigma factor family protein [Planctomycetota bacterium]